MLEPYSLAEAEFSATGHQFDERLAAMVEFMFHNLSSAFLTLPKGAGFIDFARFQAAYEVLKSETTSFQQFTFEQVRTAVEKDGLSFVVLRAILGISPPEWAEFATEEVGIAVPMGAARIIDRRVREGSTLALRGAKTLERLNAMIRAAVQLIARGVPEVPQDMLHRMDTFDTSSGCQSIRHAAEYHVPYAVLLYERFLGRPFASHRDSVSELVGNVMEDAIEEELTAANITFRRFKRPVRVPDFEQAPDFFIPTELAPSVVIEAKMTSDDGTARDKVARILRLAAIRDQRIASGQPSFQLIACVDGRGFGVRASDMTDLLRATKGRLFTLATLPQLVASTELSNFASN